MFFKVVSDLGCFVDKLYSPLIGANRVPSDPEKFEPDISKAANMISLAEHYLLPACKMEAGRA